MRFHTMLAGLIGQAALIVPAIATLNSLDSLSSILSQPRNNLWTSPNTEIFFPSSPNWEEVTLRWNNFTQPTLLANIRPGNEADVQTVVRLAKRFGIPILTVGAKHGWGLSSFTGLGLDMANFNTIDIDADANTITVGGSLTFKDIVDPLYAVGKEIPQGSCPCAGIIGVALGGGIGRYNGVHGLVLDALLSVRLVTASGHLITVSATSHPDLFWAIRGAGHNFGVITTATFRVADLSNAGQDVFTADMVFPATANASYFALLGEISGTFPPELSVLTFLAYNADMAGTVLTVNFLLLGGEEQGRELLAPFLELGPVVENIYTVPVNELGVKTMFGAFTQYCIPGIRASVYGVNIMDFDVDTWEELFGKMAARFESTPEIRGSAVLIELMGRQAVENVPNSETAYPWRDALGTILIQTTWTDDPSIDVALAMGDELRQDVAATSGYDGLAVYMNYVHGDETPKQMYGDSLDRLMTLKRRWDGDEMFSFYRPIPIRSIDESRK